MGSLNNIYLKEMADSIGTAKVQDELETSCPTGKQDYWKLTTFMSENSGACMEKLGFAHVKR